MGDLSSIRQTRELADSVNAKGRFDAVIHNAGVGYRERRAETEDGLEHVFVFNVLAPFLLTALVERPDRLVYLSLRRERYGHDGGLRVVTSATQGDQLVKKRESPPVHYVCRMRGDCSARGIDTVDIETLAAEQPVKDPNSKRRGVERRSSPAQA